MSLQITPSAPTGDTYILQTADSTLPNAQALGALSSGVMKVTTATGVITSVAAPSGAIVGDTDTQTVSNKTLTSPLFQGTIDGWISASETWTYLSADAPTFVVTVPSDATVKYQPGMRIKLTQTTVKYFIITAVTSTTLTVYGGANYALVNAAISANYYAEVKAPFGFPLDPLGWTQEVTDSVFRSQTSPVVGTWYNLNAADSLSVPIGSWLLYYKTCIQVHESTAGALEDYLATLSTTNNGQTDSDFTARNLFTFPASAYNGSPVSLQRHVLLASKTTYYLNLSTGTASNIDYIGINGSSSGTTVIRATCAYL